MTCEGREAVNRVLASRNARVAFGFTFNDDKMKVSPAMIMLEKVDPARRGKLPILLATYCPFCGKKHD